MIKFPPSKRDQQAMRSHWSVTEVTPGNTNTDLYSDTALIWALSPITIVTDECTLHLQGGDLAVFVGQAKVYSENDVDISAKLLESSHHSWTRMTYARPQLNRVALQGRAQAAQVAKRLFMLVGELKLVQLSHSLAEAKMIEAIIACIEDTFDDQQARLRDGIFMERLDTLNATIAREASNPAFGVSELASLTGMNQKTILTIFNIEGLTTVEAITRARIIKAVAMLTDRDRPARPVTEIALASGFTSLNYFTRKFKELMGVTPSNFRFAQTPLTNQSNTSNPNNR